MRITMIIKAVVISLVMGLLTPLCVSAQTAQFPNQMDAKTKQLKKLRGKAQNVFGNARNKKEVSQKAIDEMLEAYADVEQKAPADLASAALLVSEAYAALGDRDTQMKYLKIVNENYDKATKQVKLCSRIDLGWNNYRGYGTPKDEDKALEYFVQAFELDSIQGAYPMAMASLYGIGSMPVDFNMTAEFLLISKHGLRWPVIYAINYFLENVEKNPDVLDAWDNYLSGFEQYSIFGETEKALPYINKAIEAGFLPAYQLLGDIYLEKGNREKAVEVVQPAVAAGYLPAIHQKGWYIYSGTIMKMFQQKPIAEAFELFMEAANAGYPPAQIVVAQLCLMGSGGVVKIDNQMAYKQASAAQEVGEPMADELAERACKAIKKDEIDNLKAAILGLKSSVDNYRLLSMQNKCAKQSEAARKNRQGDNYIAPDGVGDPSASSLAGAAAESQDRVNKAQRDNFMFYRYQKYYRDAISKIITIETELNSDNRKGYTKKDLEAAKRNAREIREKGNSYGRSSNSTIPKSKYED